MEADSGEMPAFVQNRSYSRLGWDRDVRLFCSQHDIVYQAFSLLTDILEVLRNAQVADIAARAHATPAQVVFNFAGAIGMLPPAPRI
jgi:diketogulonate reductase-like aldo/keto reductase